MQPYIDAYVCSHVNVNVDIISGVPVYLMLSSWMIHRRMIWWCLEYWKNYNFYAIKYYYFNHPLVFIPSHTLPMLLYFGKRKQVTKIKFLLKKQNVSVISTDFNGNIRMSYLTCLLAGWVFMHKIWPGRRAH